MLTRNGKTVNNIELSAMLNYQSRYNCALVANLWETAKTNNGSAPNGHTVAYHNCVVKAQNIGIWSAPAFGKNTEAPATQPGSTHL